jgi:electron transfer flavoprotein beta subunit
MLQISVLVSEGRHPASGRPRRADLDARAAALARALPDAGVRLLHAGNPASPALRQYLGMGFDEVEVVETPPGYDVVTALTAALRDRTVDLILAGRRAEQGEGSGMLPYLVSQALGLPILDNVVDVQPQAGAFIVLAALPGGNRRRCRIRAPAMLTIGAAAPEPTGLAYGPARRGRVRMLGRATRPEPSCTEWRRLAPGSRPRKHLASAIGLSTQDRLAVLHGAARASGQVIRTDSAVAAAEMILRFCRDRGVLRRHLPLEGEAGCDREEERPKEYTVIAENLDLGDER